MSKTYTVKCFNVANQNVSDMQVESTTRKRALVIAANFAAQRNADETASGRLIRKLVVDGIERHLS